MLQNTRFEWLRADLKVSTSSLLHVSLVMVDTSKRDNPFVSAIVKMIKDNLSDERFGVSELAEAMNMSRSNLLRRVKKETHLSVSQFINQIRLQEAMILLQTTDSNVSEVAMKVGFNSVSYFIKCFREHFGYPPGEVGKRDFPVSATEELDSPPNKNNRRFRWPYLIAAVCVTLVAAFLVILEMRSGHQNREEKAIAILPFKNDSNDSTNVYVINGLMEATLNNLQQIKELRVISRTSAEKYRNSRKSIREIADELDVNYFVEGSGQKIGDRIVLNIQLIDAETDKHLWAKQYRRETKQIFELQNEIAKNIAAEIEVLITPEEQRRIEQQPTDNLVAYDYYLKGKDLFYKSKRNDLETALEFFKKAINEDPDFALAYATAAMVYYYLDIFQTEKKYVNSVTDYATMAMSLDPALAESLIAKGLDLTNRHQYQEAVSYFEKALILDRNNGLILHFLVEFYSVHIPSPRKHLVYALKKLKNDLPVTDSATAGFNYFHVSNALFETGFIDESLTYINRSLAYDPNGFFSGYFKIYVQHAKHDDARRTKEALLAEWKKDTTRFDIMQEVAKTCFMMKDYQEAFHYYKAFDAVRKKLQLDLYRHEDVRMSIVYAKMGLMGEAENLMRSFREYAENSQTSYRHLHLSMYYAAIGDRRNAIEHFREFSMEDEFHYAVLWINGDPIFESLKDAPEFKEAMKTIERKFWKAHEEIQQELLDEPLP